MPSISPSQRQRQVEHRAWTVGRVPAPLATNSLQGNLIKVIKEPGPELVLCLQLWSHISAQLCSWGRLLPSLGLRKGRTLEGSLWHTGRGTLQGKGWQDKGNGFKLTEQGQMRYWEGITPCEGGGPWHRVPRDAVAAPSMKGFQAGLDGAWSKLGQWKVSLSMAWVGLDAP